MNPFMEAENFGVKGVAMPSVLDERTNPALHTSPLASP